MYVHLIIICGGSPNCCWKWTPSLDFKTAVLLPVSTCHLMGCTFTGSHTSSFYFQNYSTETHPDSNSVTENGQKLHMKADHLVEFRQRKVLWWRVLGTYISLFPWLFWLHTELHNTVAYLEDKHLLESISSGEIANVIFTLNDHSALVWWSTLATLCYYIALA